MDFKTQKISFCDQQADNVMTADSKKFILDIVNKYDITINKKYALILNDKSLRYLKLNPHLITTKTGGSNYYLFMTKINDINSCFFIDRKVKQGYSLPRIISVKYRFSDDVFNDTLLDGELVKDKNNNWMFLIQNMLVYKGEFLKCNIVTKYNKLYKMFDNDYTVDSNFDICPLKIKKIFTYDQYDQLITQYIPQLTYPIRGLYFNTLNNRHANYLFLYNKNNNNDNENKSGFKLKKKEVIDSVEETPKSNDSNKNTSKEVSNNTTFELRKTSQPEIYELYGVDEMEYKQVGVAYISGLRASKKIKKFFKDDEPIKVNCIYVEKFKKWEPIELTNNSIFDINKIKTNNN